MEQSTKQQQAQPPVLNTQVASPGGGSTALPSGTNGRGEGRRISCEDIQRVQNLIEQCLQLYMNRTEVINTLLTRAEIESGFTGLVWQKLEEQNPDFFKAYYVRLKLKRQIMLFNHFLEQHAQLTQKMHTMKTPLPALQNVHHMPIGYPAPQQPPMAIASYPHAVSMPVAPSPVMEASPVAEGFAPAHGSPRSSNMNPDMSLLPNCALNIGSNAVLQEGSAFPFTGVGNPTDMSGMGMDVPASFAPDASFHPTENHAQNGMGSLQIPADADGGGGKELFGLFSHLPRNFSLSDLTAELSNSTDILGSYMGSPFLIPDADVFIRSSVLSDDEKMIDRIPDSTGYDGFEKEK